MKNTIFFLAVVFLTSGCLVDNLETLTADTKNAVIRTHDDQALGAYITWMNSDPNPQVRQNFAVKVMWTAPIDDLNTFFGASLPLNEGSDTITHLPNVTLVATNSEYLGRTGGVTPQAWLDRATACKSAFLKIIRDATNAGAKQADRDAVPDRTWRTILVCTAIAGARAQHWNDDYNMARLAWPQTEYVTKVRTQVKIDVEKFIHETLPRARLPAWQERLAGELVTTRMINHYDEAPPPAPTSVQKTATNNP